MNLYCTDCDKFLGIASFAVMIPFTLEIYCHPCERKFRQDFGIGEFKPETIVNNDADLETKFTELMTQGESTT